MKIARTAGAECGWYSRGYDAHRRRKAAGGTTASLGRCEARPSPDSTAAVAGLFTAAGMTPERRTAAFRELLISVGEAGKRSPAEGWKSALEVVQAINLAMIDILAPSLAEALLRRAAMGGLPNKAECRALDSLRALEGAVSKIGRTLVKLRGRKERVHEYRGP